MNRNLIIMFAVVLNVYGLHARADVVLDWNSTMRQVIKDVPDKANPGLSTRAIGMMNAAIYDVFQSFDHTHKSFLIYKTPDSGASLQAAVARAARDILADCYAEASPTWTGAYDSSMVGIPADARQKGEALGAAIAAKYIHKHQTDGWDVPGSYTPVGGAGHWTTDPFWKENPGPVEVQSAWGAGWGNVQPWTMGYSEHYKDQFASVLTDIGGLTLTSDAYKSAYNQVLNYGALDVYGPGNTPTSRSTEQAQIGRFWGYDVPSFGPPPVLFLKNLEEIANQTGNTEAQNARLFAMASVAIADAAIAAWNIKFETDFWRPVTAIHAGDNDTNPDTVGDPDWRPLGAPGHGIVGPDFTPPFPAYTSGHATMGGALFKTLELFYGENEFENIVGVDGAQFYLTSDEPDGGGTRYFSRFTELDLAALVTDLSSVDSPEGENAISRVFLGIHWIFDGTDGVRLGNAIAQYAAGSHFLAVPEPASMAMALIAISLAGLGVRRRRAYS